MNHTLRNADCAEGFGGEKSLELVSFFGGQTHSAGESRRQMMSGVASASRRLNKNDTQTKKRKLGRVQFFSFPEMTSIFEMAAANFYQKNPDIKDKPFNPDVIKTMQVIKKRPLAPELV